MFGSVLSVKNDFIARLYRAMCIDKAKACVNMAFHSQKICETEETKQNTWTKQQQQQRKVAATAKIQEDDHFRTGG